MTSYSRATGHSSPLQNINTDQNFEAYLKADDGKIFEMGYASASKEKKAVDFVGDFVPIMELHSKATIVKIIDGRECHSFEGEVYLSSKNRLQLSNVTDKLLSYQEMTIAQRVAMAGTVYAIAFLPPEKRGGLAQKQLKKTNVEIFSVSLREIGFTVPKTEMMDSHLLLQISEPILMRDVELEVFRQLQFSEEKTVCYATIESLPASARKSLVGFLSSRLIIFP